ncbi:MAG: flagellar export chaperone FliS [Treponema sp.]|jgi:flagellar protein FliS|nr:flagellar export chaperone FliS [Treponema sp.]
MGFNQAYSAYQKTNVTTASQGKLVVLLYEAAVKNLKLAAGLLDSEDNLKPGDIENFGKYIQKTQSIINELEVSLDMENGGEIAKNLMSLYLYFNSELTNIAIKHSGAKISFLIEMMSELLGAWKSASESTSNAPASTSLQNHTALNIQG